ncbi:hypothetical protein [Streptomyces sp. NPDC056492]|uniref:hypothetical protein n=1 Tax=unclassified Streptomyces TaxID=2593676 RepID=UPI00369B3A84
MSSKKARTWVPTVTAAAAVAALAVPLAAGQASAASASTDDPAACATAPVSDRAKPVVEFACSTALQKVDAKQFSPNLMNAGNYFIAEAWKKGGVELKGMANSETFYPYVRMNSIMKTDMKKIAPGDIVFMGAGGSSLAYGVYLGDDVVAGYRAKTQKIEILPLAGMKPDAAFEPK